MRKTLITGERKTRIRQSVAFGIDYETDTGKVWRGKTRFSENQKEENSKSFIGKKRKFDVWYEKN